MTAVNKSRSEDDAHRATPVPCEGEVDCCGHDHGGDEDIPIEASSHCGDGCCGDDEESDCESNVDPCEDSCCGHQEDHSVHQEPEGEEDPQGTELIGSCVRRG